MFYVPKKVKSSNHLHIYIYVYMYIYIYSYDIWAIKLVEIKSIYGLVFPGGFFRVEEFKDLLVFVSYVYNWKI